MTTATKKRTKRPALTIRTMEEAEGVMAEMATADAQLRKTKAEMDEQITAVRKRYEADLTELQETRDQKEDMLWGWAETNPELFEKKKSLDLIHGVLGFRTGTPKLKLLKKSWDAVLVALRVKNADYIRTKEEVNKERLLEERNDEDTQKLMKDVGVAVVQEETFFVELKTEGAE